MARFSDETVSRVKDAADIVEVVSAYTDLRRAGARFQGLCPFHDERTPSFSVDPVQKVYYCFGCEAGGDIFSFVQEKEGIDFPDAIETLAERYGVELEREQEDPKLEAARRKRARAYELLARTSEFYVRYLWESPKAAKARDYLLGRGLTEETLREFSVGMAPSAWDSVLVGSQRARFTIPELVGAGLIQKGRQGGHYDRFRSRITFPIRDARGRVLGFGARALSPDSKPKYLNSPEGIFIKSENLYGIERARQAIAKARRAIVVEGYTDVLALHQAGVTEAVAIMGTAITPEQLQALSALGPESVVLALDADKAGANAMIRAQRVAADRTLELRVAAMPEGEDPADMLAEGHIDRFHQIVEGAIDLPTFQVDTILQRADAENPAGRERALKEVLQVLKAMGEAVGRDELVRKASDQLNVPASMIMERLGTTKLEEQPLAADFTPPTEAPAQRAPLTPREARERALLGMCISEPRAGREVIARLRPEHMSASGAPALEWLRDHLDAPMEGLPREDEALVALITELTMRAEREPHSPAAMELNFMLLEQQRLDDDISAARQAGNFEEVSRLSQEGSKLTARISHSDSPGS